MSEPRNLQARQGGYALPEVLIATAIAAGVFAASATAVSNMIRLSSSVSGETKFLHEAKTLTTRIQGGIDPLEIRDSFEGWTIEVTKKSHENQNGRPQEIQYVSLSKKHRGRIQSFEVLLPHTDE